LGALQLDFMLSTFPRRRANVSFPKFGVKSLDRLLGFGYCTASIPHTTPTVAGKMSTARPEDGKIGIVIADDHAIVRSGVRHLLETQPDMRVVGEAGDGYEAVKLTLRLEPDVLLLDLVMPHKSGMEALRDLADHPIKTKILMLTASIDRDIILECMQLGARGVVLKEVQTALLYKCIRCVHTGQIWIGNESISQLADAFRQLIHKSQLPEPKKPFGLTRRESDIVQAISSGLSNRDIAEKLQISHQTVKNHLTAIFDKVGVSSRLELALLATKDIEAGPARFLSV
jgi:two-component system, NarL family, nitrate/nitrite response regulator NarL